MLVALMDVFWLLAFAASLGTWPDHGAPRGAGAAGTGVVSSRLPVMTLALSVASATTLFGLVAWFTPNVLSIWSALTVPAVAVCWLAAIAVLALTCRIRIAEGWTRVVSELTAVAASWREPRTQDADGVHSGWNRAGNLLWAGAVVTLLLLTLASATLYPPTVWDSHSHHLPRLVQFIQNQTVAPFPTYYPSMNATYPLTAYVNAQVALLWGSTNVLNIVQWLAYLGSAVLVYAITLKIGGGRTAARVATLVALSAPSVALQASSTQYDLVTALWCLIAILLMLELRSWASAERPPLWLAALFGAALGLGAVTKITFIVLLIPFCIWLVVSFLRSGGLRRTVIAGATTLLVAALVVAPWIGQNVALDSGALGTSSPGNNFMLVQDRSPGALWTNAIRNSFMQLATPVAPVNRAIERGAALLAAPLGVPIDSPINKEDFDRGYELPTWTFSPDMASSPLTALAMVAGVLALFAAARKTDLATPLVYAACAAVGTAIIAAFVTWNPFITRSLGTAILVASPAAGIGLAQIAGAAGGTLVRRTLVGGLLVAALGFGMLAVVFNASAPLLSRTVVFGGTWSGHWNLPYQERGWAVDLPFVRADIEAVRGTAVDVARASVNNGWSTGAGVPLLALIGGEAGDHMPAYPLIRELQAAGFAVRYEGRFGPAEMPGASSVLNGVTPGIILSYDFMGDAGTTVAGGTPSGQNPAYRTVYQRYSPELETTLTVLVHEALVEGDSQ